MPTRNTWYLSFTPGLKGCDLDHGDLNHGESVTSTMMTSALDDGDLDHGDLKHGESVTYTMVISAMSLAYIVYECFFYQQTDKAILVG